MIYRRLTPMQGHIFLRNMSKLPGEIRNKFRGSLLGSLVGDCLGGPFEGKDVTSGDKIIIQRYFDKMEDPTFKAPFKKYTDDTAMMKSVAKFLIDKPEPDLKYLAKLFVIEYYNDPRRGYGANVVEVFEKLRNSKYEDIFLPAREQFNGSGSYGNGGAMRIAPIALYFYDDYENMINIARGATKITHNNTLGIDGALLQCIAVREAFCMDAKTPVDGKEFCSRLREEMKAVECGEDEDLPLITAYQDKIKQVEELLQKNFSDELDFEVIDILGNGISAYESVPTAIYCFLRAQKEIPRIETNNVFRRAIQYAISFGGDTDTIACMTGAIAGAHLGEEAISKELRKHCEKYEEIIGLADDLVRTKTDSK